MSPHNPILKSMNKERNIQSREAKFAEKQRTVIPHKKKCKTVENMVMSYITKSNISRWQVR